MAVRDIEHCQATTMGAFRAWPRKIAKHRILDQAKGLARQKRKPTNAVRYLLIDVAAEQIDPAEVRAPFRSLAREPTVEGKVRYQMIRREITNLPPAQRHAILLHYLDGKTISATAAVMNRSTGAVRGLLQRARNTLRERCSSD